MTIIVCISESGGMMFNKRRQSRDRILTEDMLSLVGDRALYITEFSKKLFEESKKSPIIHCDPLSVAKGSDFVFIESLPLKEHVASIDKMIIYHWNRSYPSDFYLDTPPMENGFSLKSSYEFEGSSHERITREVWEKE